MDVTDVLRDRRSMPDGLQRRAAAISMLAHGTLAAFLVLAPSAWFASSADEPRVVMTLSLNAGSPGPAVEDMTQIGGIAAQVQTPPDNPNRPEPTPTPAPETKMTVPVPDKTLPKQTARTTVKDAPDEARGRTPTRGEETAPGSALRDTGVRGQGFGLTASGGAGSGVTFDVLGTFCCTQYAEKMKQDIMTGWSGQFDVAAKTLMKFTILRNGTITNVEVEKSSGFQIVDLRSQRQLQGRRLLPLPQEFTPQTLTVHLWFEYTR